MATSLRGPTAELHLASDADEPTILVLDAPYRELPALRTAVEGVQGFLARPMVPGVAPLEEVDLPEGRLAWRSGPCIPLAQLLATHRDGLGARAACELGWLASQVLADAADAGASQGVYAHGDVSPWTLAVSPWGELVVLAYGLPEPEWQRLRRTGGVTPRAASLAWAPPERIEGRPEDARSDGFSLALVLTAALYGAPLYDAADPTAALADARGGDAAARLGRKRSGPSDLREHLGGMLARSPDHRPDPRAWADGWAPLLARHADGPTLAELARGVDDAPLPAPNPAPRGGLRATRSYSLDHLRALARRLEALPDEDEATDESSPTPKKATKAPPAPKKATKAPPAPKKATKAPPAPKKAQRAPPEPGKAEEAPPASKKAAKAPPEPKPTKKAAKAPPPPDPQPVKKPVRAPAEPSRTDAADRPKRRDG